jgi:hypothetical protein
VKFIVKDIGFIEHIDKKKCRKYDSFFSTGTNYLDKFEKNPPPKR